MLEKIIFKYNIKTAWIICSFNTGSYLQLVLINQTPTKELVSLHKPGSGSATWKTEWHFFFSNFLQKKLEYVLFSVTHLAEL